MNLHVGPLIYRVYLWHGLIQHEGRPCLGLCDHDEQVVLISDTVKGERQLQVLCHEAWHIWRHHFPNQCSNEEGQADLAGMLLVQLMKDLGTPAKINGLSYAPQALHALPGDSIAAKILPG